jgi:hypothetical protein
VEKICPEKILKKILLAAEEKISVYVAKIF